MTAIWIANRQQIRWVVDNDPTAEFVVFEATATGMEKSKTYKSLPRNIDRLDERCHSDAMCVVRLSPNKAEKFRRWWANVKAQQAARPNPLLPVMPLPPHLRRNED